MIHQEHITGLQAAIRIWSRKGVESSSTVQGNEAKVIYRIQQEYNVTGSLYFKGRAVYLFEASFRQFPVFHVYVLALPSFLLGF